MQADCHSRSVMQDLLFSVSPWLEFFHPYAITTGTDLRVYIFRCPLAIRVDIRLAPGNPFTWVFFVWEHVIAASSRSAAFFRLVFSGQELHCNIFTAKTCRRIVQNAWGANPALVRPPEGSAPFAVDEVTEPSSSVCWRRARNPPQRRRANISGRRRRKTGNTVPRHRRWWGNGNSTMVRPRG